MPDQRPNRTSASTPARTMRAAVLTGVERLEVRGGLPVPPPGPFDVLVGVRAVGLCGTDFHIYAGHGNYNTGERGVPVPLEVEPQILGHEIVGVVEEAGNDVHDLRPGDLVVLDQGVSCVSVRRDPLCEYCATGDSHQAPTIANTGSRARPAGWRSSSPSRPPTRCGSTPGSTWRRRH
jgi:L-iditol 2-dehydrogenase